MVRSGDTADRSAERTSSSWTAIAAALAFTVAPTVAGAQTPTEPAQPAAEPTQPAPASTVAPAPISNAEAPQAVDAPSAARAAQPDQDLVLLEADVIINDEAAQTVTAEGDVQVRHLGRTMRADTLVYHLDTGQVEASGNVEIINADGTATYAERVEADDELNVAVANELRARLGQNGSLAARTVLRHGPGESELRNIIYTSCPICRTSERPPTWSLQARRAIQDRESRTISYQSATLEVAGVPVLYLPYFAHPDPSVGRASGLLPPDFGRNSRLGTFYEQPYYWAISPSQDATVSAMVSSHVHPLFGVEYRKRFWSGSIEAQGTVTYEQDFDGDGNTFGDETYRSSLFAQGRFHVNDYWDWGFGAERISDDLYLRRYDIRGANEERGPFLGTRTRLISQLYAQGQDESSYSSVAFVSFQGLRANDSTFNLPLILPYAEYDGVFDEPVLDGQVRLQANTAMLQRSEYSAGRGDDARVSVSAKWRNEAIFGPGMLFSPFAQARGDLYRAETSLDHYETFGRALGYAGAEVSWPFMRAGEKVDIVVEPVAMVAYASDDEPDDRIVNEDSLAFELDDSNLFRPNGAPNYDLWERGGRATLGVRASARAHTGETASVTFGRRWRQEADDQFSTASNLSDKTSDWIGAVGVDLGRYLGADVRFRLEDESLELRRLDVGARAAWSRFYGNARYYSIDDVLAGGDPSEEINGTVGVEIARGWSAEAGLRRDLDSGINLSQQIRAIYQDDCTFLEIAYTRSETRDRTLGPSEGLQIRIGLRSLGVVGGS
ncbi:MAG: LPS assembly protein LptD [Hyphomonadaceae bacterium]|nr:LPS assembly protein LptD [Hyphomonadaceae bacterium]